MISAILQYRFKKAPDAALYAGAQINHEEIGYFLQENLREAQLVDATAYQGDIDNQAEEAAQDGEAGIYFDILAGIEEAYLDNVPEYRAAILDALLDDFETSVVKLVQWHSVGEDQYFEIQYGDPYLP